MQLANAILHVVLLGTVFGQAPYLQGPNQILPSRLQQQVRQQELSALDQMMNVKTVEHFMALLRKDGRNVTKDDIFHRSSGSPGRRITLHGGYLAEPDECSPREMTVQLDLGLEAAAPDQVFFPRCTKVMRCGGCCSSGLASCRPVEVERSLVNVLKGQVPFPGADYLIFTGFAKVMVERHLSCERRCDLSPDKCGVNKIFLPHQCVCVCDRPQRCLGPKAWNQDTCQCACSTTRECPKGQGFSQDTCRCEEDLGKQETSHYAFNHPDDLNKFLIQESHSPNVAIPDGKLLGDVMSAPAPLTPPAGDNVRTEEPEEESFTERRRKALLKQNGVCSHLYCPPFFMAVMRSGVCVCTPKEPSSSRFRRKHLMRRKLRSWRKTGTNQKN